MKESLKVSEQKIVILAEESFSVLGSKAATVLIRYHAQNVVAVIDSTKAGKSASEIIGIGKGIPVVASLDVAMSYGPTLLAIGIAPPGGELPPDWLPILVEAISNGLHIVSGMHHFLSDNAVLSNLATKHDVFLWDVRKPPKNLSIASCRALEVLSTIILTVGSDCRTGKMVTAIELANGLRSVGKRAAFCATGQNGIMVSGWGIAIDAVISDFTAGAAETIVLQGVQDNDILVVEGQGSLVHPAYSGVTLSLLHGSQPDAMIFCHQPSRTQVARHAIKFPSLGEMIDQYETLARPIKPAKIIGVSLNTFDLTFDQSLEVVDLVEAETGLPATDVIRFGSEKLVDSIIDISEKKDLLNACSCT